MPPTVANMSYSEPVDREYAYFGALTCNIAR